MNESYQTQQTSFFSLNDSYYVIVFKKFIFKKRNLIFIRIFLFNISNFSRFITFFLRCHDFFRNDNSVFRLIFRFERTFAISKHTSIFVHFFFHIDQFHSIFIDQIFVWRLFRRLKYINIQDFIAYDLVKIISIDFEFFWLFSSNQYLVVLVKSFSFYFRISDCFVFLDTLHDFLECLCALTIQKRNRIYFFIIQIRSRFFDIVKQIELIS